VDRNKKANGNAAVVLLTNICWCSAVSQAVVVIATANDPTVRLYSKVHTEAVNNNNMGPLF
jgi:hypothetical protein